MSRYFLLDTIRGICILSMVLDHLFWDCVYLFDIPLPFFHTNFAEWYRILVRCSFIGLAGFCFSMSRKPVRRGLLISLCGLVITITSFLFSPNTPILFGILTFIGSAMLLTFFLQPVLQKIPCVLGASLSFFLFICFYHINDGYILQKFMPYSIYQALYCNLFTAFLGFPSINFISADYFSLLPWIFMFWYGYFLYQIFTKNKTFIEPIFSKNIFFLTFIGQRSLLIYFCHQPIIYAILYIYFSYVRI